MTRAPLAAVLPFLLVAAMPAWGQSPLVAELESFATRYHEDPARLDKIRKGLAEAVKAEAHVENLVALARVCFIWGDIRAADRDQKLEAYAEGREAARRAIELDPKNVAAHFWRGANTGRWGQTKGVLRSLFLLPTVREEIETVLKTLIKKGRIAEAQRELEAVLGEREPANPADWTLKDSKEARQLLDSLKGKS